MSTCTIKSLKKITHFKKVSSDRNSHKLLVSFFHIWFSTSSEENVEEIWFIIMIIIISYSYLITTTTYYLSKHPTCKKNHLIYYSVAIQRKMIFFFWFLTYFLPILDPRYLRFTVQIPVFRDNFQIKKAKKYKCVRSWFCKINATSTATKNLSLKKKESNPKL